MAEAGGDLDLLEKTRAADRLRGLRPDDLDRDAPAVLEILGQIDGRHAAMPPLPSSRSMR
jgi:hypothetical protein